MRHNERRWLSRLVSLYRRLSTATALVSEDVRLI